MVRRGCSGSMRRTVEGPSEEVLKSHLMTVTEGQAQYDSGDQDHHTEKIFKHLPQRTLYPPNDYEAAAHGDCNAKADRVPLPPPPPPNSFKTPPTPNLHFS
jgi:hypothetical protein